MTEEKREEKTFEDIIADSRNMLGDIFPKVFEGKKFKVELTGEQIDNIISSIEDNATEYGCSPSFEECLTMKQLVDAAKAGGFEFEEHSAGNRMEEIFADVIKDEILLARRKDEVGGYSFVKTISDASIRTSVGLAEKENNEFNKTEVK